MRPNPHKTIRTTAMSKSGSPCCGSNGGCCPPPKSRYPVQPPIKINSSMWAKPTSPATPQFASDTSSNSNCCSPNTSDPPFTYTGNNLSAINFPLGGFAAGNVKIASDGTLQHFSNVNQPKETNVHMPNCFWGISATPANAPAQTQSFVLASPQTFNDHTCNLPPHEPAAVPRAAVHRLQQLPGVQSFTLTGKYPIANLDYQIPTFPIQVSMEATSPCIPQDIKNSSLPTAIFTFTLTNPSKTTTMNVRLLQSQQNYIGWDGTSDCSTNTNAKWGGNTNAPAETSTFVAMHMFNPTTPDGTMSLAGVKSTSTTLTVLPSAANANAMWTQFIARKDVVPAQAPATSPPSATTLSTCCGIVQSIAVAPQTSVKITYVLTWHFPNRLRNKCGLGSSWSKLLPSMLGNRYCDWFPTSTAVTQYVVQHRTMLLDTTRLYTKTMFDSTLPPEVRILLHQLLLLLLLQLLLLLLQLLKTIYSRQ